MKPKLLPVSKLDLDTLNPRLHIEAESQDDALRLMMETEGASIYGLAKDIAFRGTLNPTDPLIVIEEGGRFTVLEGNRRLCALRLLRRPQLAPTPGDQAKFARLAKQQTSVIEKAQVVVAADRAAANQWIEVKHSGPGTGAGTKGWGPQSKRTFAARTHGTKTYIEAVVDGMKSWYSDDDGLLADLHTIVHGKQLTNFERILEGREGQKALGLRLMDGAIEGLHSPEDLKPFLSFLVKSMAAPLPKGSTPWSRLWGNAEQQRDWLKDHSQLLPQPEQRSPNYVRHAPGPTESTTAQPTRRPASSSGPTTPRPGPGSPYKNPFDGPKLNLDGFVIHGEYPAPIHLIAEELTKMKIEDVPNTLFDVLRSFVEKTIKAFAYQQREKIDHNGQFVQLSDCLRWLERYCGDHSSLKQFKGVVAQIRTSKSNFAVTSDAYNAANHDHNLPFGPADVRQAWNTVHPVMKELLRLGPVKPE